MEHMEHVLSELPRVFRGSWNRVEHMEQGCRVQNRYALGCSVAHGTGWNTWNRVAGYKIGTHFSGVKKRKEGVLLTP